MRGHFATDLVAMLADRDGGRSSHQPLAGLVIVLMQTGGEALERYAEGRASAAVRALEEEAPRIAHRIRRLMSRRRSDGRVDDVSVGDVAVGDHPARAARRDDARATASSSSGSSHVDTSRSPASPFRCAPRVGDALSSGSLNLDGALVVRATATAGASQYARIVELVRSAQSSKAPLQRLADRYAVWFTPVTLVACAVTWVASGDVTRVLAVLVVATPCPLILATPIAIIGGVNRAARRMIVVQQRRRARAARRRDRGGVRQDRHAHRRRAGGERRASARTDCQPTTSSRLAASVECALGASPGALGGRARPKRRGLALPPVTEVTRVDRVAASRAVVDDRRVCVGARGYVVECVGGDTGAPFADASGSRGLRAYVARRPDSSPA